MLYLPLFFFSLASIVLVNQLRNWPYKWVIITLSTLYLIYPLELLDYLITNYNASIIVSHSYGLNTLLTNVLNRYHPLVFYTSVFFFFSYLARIRVPNNSLKNTSLKGFTLVSIEQVCWWGILINLVALWMGSWWALQEGTWGGWWNWDSSEVFGLLITISLLSLTHTSLTLNSITFTRFKSFQLSSLFVISYFFIQLNFELVSHNFGSKFFFFFNNNLFFIEALLLLLFLFLSWYYLSNSLFTRSILYTGIFKSKCPSTTPSLLIRLIVPSILLLWVLLSYKPLLNYFLWNFAQLNLFNSDVSLQQLNFVLMLVGFVWLSNSSNYSTFLLLVSLLHLSNWFLATLLSFRLNKSLLSSHSLLIVVLVTNLLIFDLVIYRWAISTDWLPFNLKVGRVFTSQDLITLDSTAVDICQTSSSYSFDNDVSWNISTLTNTPSLNFFSLLSSNDLFYNLYDLANIYAKISLCIELPLISPLNLMFWFILSLVWRHLTSKITPNRF